VPASEEQALAAIDNMLALLDRAAAGGEVSAQEWSAAMGASRRVQAVTYAAATYAVAAAAETADWSWSWSSRSWSSTEVVAPPWGAWWAAMREAAWAAWAARPARATAEAAVKRAPEDRMIDQMLSAMEREVRAHVRP